MKKRYQLKQMKKKVKSKEIELYVIELPKVKYSNDKMNRKKEWIIYLEGSNIEKIEKIKEENKYICELDKQLEKYWENETME